MRCHLLVVSQRKVYSNIGGATITFCMKPTYITNMSSFSSIPVLGVMLHTDAGHLTPDYGPTALYYKLTGELKALQTRPTGLMFNC